MRWVKASSVRAERAELEDAIAALVGENPSNFAVEQRVVDATTPVIPVGVPSTRLQRRPDIAAAGQRITAAAEGVGVARSSWFPSILSALPVGFRAASWRAWCHCRGAAVARDVLGARRRVQVEQSEAVLEEPGQRYRATVLGAFQ